MKIKDLESLPHCSVVSGQNFFASAVEMVPSRLTVEGDLILGMSAIVDLPNGLVVSGDLSVIYTAVKHIPSDLVVSKTLVMAGTYVKTLPDTLKCKTVHCDEGQLDDHSMIMCRLKSIEVDEI